MKKIFWLSVFISILIGCHKKSDFVIFHHYQEPNGILSQETFFVYTNSSDSLEILKYSYAIDNKVNGNKKTKEKAFLVIFYCHDSSKHPYYQSGKFNDYKNTSFVSYSNSNWSEKFNRINFQPGKLYFNKEYKPEEK